MRLFGFWVEDNIFSSFSLSCNLLNLRVSSLLSYTTLQVMINKQDMVDMVIAKIGIDGRNEKELFNDEAEIKQVTVLISGSGTCTIISLLQLKIMTVTILGYWIRDYTKKTSRTSAQIAEMVDSKQQTSTKTKSRVCVQLRKTLEFELSFWFPLSQRTGLSLSRGMFQIVGNLKQ